MLFAVMDLKLVPYQHTWVNGTSVICAVFCPWMAMEKATVQKVHAVRFKKKILFLMG